MTEIKFDRDAAAGWLRGHAPGTDYPRAEEYGECIVSADGAPVFVRVDTEQLGTLVDDYGFGEDVRLIVWVDDDEMGGVKVDVELPVPGDDAHPLRLAGSWAEMLTWVECDALSADDDEAIVSALADFLAKVAEDANGTLTVARSAVAAGVLATPRERPNPLDDPGLYCLVCRDPGHDDCGREVDGCPCCANTDAS